MVALTNDPALGGHRCRIMSGYCPLNSLIVRAVGIAEILNWSLQALFQQPAALNQLKLDLMVVKCSKDGMGKGAGQ